MPIAIHSCLNFTTPCIKHRVLVTLLQTSRGFQPRANISRAGSSWVSWKAPSCNGDLKTYKDQFTISSWFSIGDFAPSRGVAALFNIAYSARVVGFNVGFAETQETSALNAALHTLARDKSSAPALSSNRSGLLRSKVLCGFGVVFAFPVHSRLVGRNADSHKSTVQIGEV
jgi:hypothetical protein